MDTNQVAEVQRDAQLLCLMVAQGLSEDDARSHLGGISAAGKTMRMIERHELVVMISGPDFTPHLFTVDQGLKDYCEKHLVE